MFQVRKTLLFLVRLGFVRQVAGRCCCKGSVPNVPRRRPLVGLVVQVDTVAILDQESKRLTHNPCSSMSNQVMRVAVVFSQEVCEQRVPIRCLLKVHNTQVDKDTLKTNDFVFLDDGFGRCYLPL